MSALLTTPAGHTADLRVADIVLFWSIAGMERWFDKDAGFDAVVAHRFTDLHMEAAKGRLDEWADDATGAFALLILLDQFPRNASRGAAHAFATDGLALALAHRCMRDGFDRGCRRISGCSSISRSPIRRTWPTRRSRFASVARSALPASAGRPSISRSFGVSDGSRTATQHSAATPPRTKPATSRPADLPGKNGGDPLAMTMRGGARRRSPV